MDVLVNNAAVCEGDDILRIDGATWDAAGMAGYPLMADELLVESRDPDGA